MTAIRTRKELVMDRLLTAPEVAQLLGGKRLPSLLVGRQRRFRHSQLERWLDQQATT
jgi:hypothetical protein